MARDRVLVRITEDDPLQVFVEDAEPGYVNIEIPTELYERYKKARAELDAVNAELTRIWNGG